VPDSVVHVIDDDDAVRESLAFLFETESLRVRTYESAVHFLARVGELEPGCIVTDVRMPQMNGVELMRALAARGASLPTIVITGHGDVALAVEAMRSGAVDFIEKPFSDDLILTAVRTALARSRDERAQASERAAVIERLALLSNRERQVLDGLVAGQANKVQANALGISPRTVEVYRANLMTKMRAASLSDLVRMALLAGGAS